MGLMSSPQIQLALWISQPILQTIVAVAMFRRRLHKDFRVFFAFTLAQVGLFAINFPVYRLACHDTYFDKFWLTCAINLVFEFKLIHEVFLVAFRLYHALQVLGTALFRWEALMMNLVL